MIGRIVIDDIRPRTPTRAYPAKAVVGETVVVSADIFKDGHDLLAGRVLWRPVGKPAWNEAPLRVDNAGLDRWMATIVLLAMVPVATVVPALAALALVAAVWLALHVYELVWWREARAESRSMLAAS